MGEAESARPLTFGNQAKPNETLHIWHYDLSSFPCDCVKMEVTDSEQLVTAAPISPKLQFGDSKREGEFHISAGIFASSDLDILRQRSWGGVIKGHHTLVSISSL